MRQVVNVSRNKIEFEKQYIRGLRLELDYELATLYDAMQAKDQTQIDNSKHRLGEIYTELEAFHVFA